MNKGSNSLIFFILVCLTLAGMLGALVIGPVNIPLKEIFSILTDCGENVESHRFIVFGARLPAACAALFSGAALSVAGLMMQTLFRNPLAGPSILGISSGASLGAALLTLAFPMLAAGNSAALIAGAIAGAALVIIIISGLSSTMKSGLLLLVAGIMVSYLCSAGVSLLNFFAPADDVKSFVVWGLGSFSGLTSGQLSVFIPSLTILLIIAWLMPKPLDALLLGERYAANMGYSISAVRTSVLAVSGLLTAFTTAFCGPIGFIGLITPHVCRLIFRTSSHIILLPASTLLGAFTGLLCEIISVLPVHTGVIPVNAITPVFGVPVIMYLLLRKDKLPYFN